MNNKFAAGIVGFLFAVGLGISGMTDPQNVLSFLDIFGTWNPALAFVMIGAISVHFILYRLIRKREKPVLSAEWHIPSNSKITKSLVIGSILFGIGWGLAGYCPGPGITSLATFGARPLTFVAGMILGMLVFKAVDQRSRLKGK